MYGGGDTESERTAFRKAEKIYKLYYQSNTKKYYYASPIPSSIKLFDNISINDIYYYVGKSNQELWI